MNGNDIKLPPLPEPDGYLTIKIIGRDVEVNAYRDSTMEAYAREAVRINASQAENVDQVQALREALHAAAEYIGERSAGSSTFWDLYDAALAKENE